MYTKLTEEQINLLNYYIDNKYVNRVKHPTLPLYVHKYTKECQYKKAFNENGDAYTPSVKDWDPLLKMCRGLVLDEYYNIIAKGFDKFFNYEELDANDVTSMFKNCISIETKYDGSLLILFYYKGQWIFCTQGSFHTEFTDMAWAIFKENLYSLEYLSADYVYLFEMTSPNNRIVVHYETNKLVFLGKVNRLTLKVFNCDPSFPAPNRLSVDISHGRAQIRSSSYDEHSKWLENIIHQNDVNNIHKLYKAIRDNEPKEFGNFEGFIIKYDNNIMKIKFKEYNKVHAVMTELSEKQILLSMANGTFLSNTLEQVPDEFFEWLKSLETTFNNWYNEIKNKCNEIIDNARMFDYNGKQLNEFCTEHNPDLRSIVMNIYNNKTIEHKVWGDMIWNLVNERRKQLTVGDAHTRTFMNRFN